MHKDIDHTAEGKPMKPSNATSAWPILNIPDLPAITLQQKHSLLTTEDTAQKTPVLIQDCATAEVDPQKDYRPAAPLQISEHIIDNSSHRDTAIYQVKPFLGTTTWENSQLQSTIQPQDVSEILGTTAFEGYIQTPLQTLDSLYINQPKRFLPLAEEAKWLAKEIRKEKEAEQWARIPPEQLLNQSFLEQLNSIQALKILAPLVLPKQHLPNNIIEILDWKRLIISHSISSIQ